MAAGKAEFTLAKYQARANSVGSGYQRGSDFCILTLQHPAIDSREEEAAFRAQMEAVYERRDDLSSSSRLMERVDELFVAYDVDENGLLDPQELREAISALGLPSDDEPLQQVLRANGIDTWKGTGNLDKAGFAKVLNDIGDQTVLGTVPMHFSSRLNTLEPSLEGMRAYNWIARTAPAHFVVRALRNAWPAKRVTETAIMKNTEDNPMLDPAKMILFSRVHKTEGMLGKFASTAAHFAEATLRAPPTAKGGFVVRIREFEPQAEHYVPLRGLKENEGDVALEPASSTMARLLASVGVRQQVFS